MVEYYKYPGDGYNNWKVIVRLMDGTYAGTTRVYPSGLLLDPLTTYWREADPAWGKPISLEEAVALTAR
jgi:hypothetical protein